MGTADTLPVEVPVKAEVKQVKRRRLGILALQGAFEEHQASFNQLPAEMVEKLEVVQVRKSSEMDSCDALVIPGGESTTMKIIAGTDDFWNVLRAYVHGGAGSDGVKREPRPVWGTCAGLILLSDDVLNQMHCTVDGDAKMEPKRCKYGDPIGGADVSTCRNFFGRQAQSFEANLMAAPAGTITEDSEEARSARERAFSEFPGVFIRAPAILKTGAGIRPLAVVRHPAANSETDDSVTVAAEGKRLLLTAFHPELCQDSRVHRYFVERFVLA